MALFKFTKNIIDGNTIDIFNYGQHTRDFTYVDDIVEGIIRVLGKIPLPNNEWNSNTPELGTSSAPYKLYNIGSNNPQDLIKYIEVLEETLGIRARRNLMPMQDGDVPDTFADVDSLIEAIDYKPSTSIETGIQRFVEWYLDYYKISGNFGPQNKDI